LTWNCLAGAPVQPNFQETVRVDTIVEAAVLNMGNVDPGLTTTCLTGLGNRSFGAGGLFPRCTGSVGPRNDGLDCRVLDAGNAGGVFALFLGIAGNCPGIPLGSLADGSLYLNPGSAFVQIAVGNLDASGAGVTTAVPPNTPACARAVNRSIDFQAFTVGPAFSLPGRLTNRATVNYLP
jgi:hypothetical protein